MEIAASSTDASDAQIEQKLLQLVRGWGLSRFSEGIALQWLRLALGTSDQPREDLRRLTQWLLMQLNGQRRAAGCSTWQLGCPEVIPSLRAIAVWDCHVFPWVHELEANFNVIKSELLALRGRADFQPYRAPAWASKRRAKDGLGSVAHDAGEWNVFYLYLHNVDFATNRSLCPRTAQIIQSIGGHYNHAFFSALSPKTHVAKHHGPTNKKLRCHLPLVVPPGDSCRLRVGSETVLVQEGQCFVFDDSFEHEAWNDDASRSRIVLIVDVWHPDLTAAELKFLSFLRNSRLRMDKSREAVAPGDNFYDIISTANNLSRESSDSRQQAVWS